MNSAAVSRALDGEDVAAVAGGEGLMGGESNGTPFFVVSRWSLVEEAWIFEVEWKVV